MWKKEKRVGCIRVLKTETKGKILSRIFVSARAIEFRNRKNLKLYFSQTARSYKDEKNVKLSLWGCTPWWAQLSVCMKIPLVTFREAFENSFWFKDTEEKCLDLCQIRNSPNMCMECWMKSISTSKIAFNIFCGINEGLCEMKDAKKYFIESSSSCLRKYIPAHVDETPPMMKQANLKSIGRLTISSWLA